jgi:phenylacetate-CoA ligase
MPIVRYRTRDLTRLLPGAARTMRRMERISGRSDDMLIIRGVNVFPTQIEEQILKEAALAPHYVLEVTRPGRMDELKVVVERRADASDDEANAAAKALRHHIKTMIGVSVAVDVAPPNGVERSLGKAKRIRDLRGRSDQ